MFFAIDIAVMGRIVSSTVRYQVRAEDGSLSPSCCYFIVPGTGDDE